MPKSHHRRSGFRLTPPKVSTFLFCFALIGLGIVSRYVQIPIVTNYQFCFLSVGGIVLILSCLLRGL